LPDIVERIFYGRPTGGPTEFLKRFPVSWKRQPKQLAERVVEHLEQSGFEVDEADDTLRRKPLSPLHRAPGE
jgi:hypothetical protein